MGLGFIGGLGGLISPILGSAGASSRSRSSDANERTPIPARFIAPTSGDFVASYTRQPDDVPPVDRIAPPPADIIEPADEHRTQRQLMAAAAYMMVARTQADPGGVLLPLD
jgi:hypothetical protein